MKQSVNNIEIYKGNYSPRGNLNHWPQKLELTSDYLYFYFRSISGVGIPDNTNHGGIISLLHG